MKGRVVAGGTRERRRRGNRSVAVGGVGGVGQHALSGSNVIVNAAIRSPQHHRHLRKRKRGREGGRDVAEASKRESGKVDRYRAARGGEAGNRLPRLRRKRQHLSHASASVCTPG